MHKQTFFVALFLLALSQFVCAESDSDLFTALMAVKAQDADMSKISQQQKISLIGLLKDVVSGKIENDNTRARIYLLRLGDAQTIRELAEQFREYKNDRAWTQVPFYVERAKQPLLIEEFAKDLAQSPDKGLSGSIGDPNQVMVLVPPEPNYAGGLILKTIMVSEEFQPEVKEWARKQYLLHFQTDFLLMMRKWWEQNKAAFEAKEYGKVMPYREESVQAPAVPANATAQPVSTSVDPVPSLQPTATTPTRELSPAIPPEHSTLPWKLLAGGILSLAIVVGVMFRFLRNRRE